MDLDGSENMQQEICLEDASQQHESLFIKKASTALGNISAPMMNKLELDGYRNNTIIKFMEPDTPKN